MPATKQILGLVTLTAFALVATVGVLSLAPHHHEPGCPFMPGEEAICPMGLFEHLGAWQDVFTVALPYIFLLASALFLVIFFYFLNSLGYFANPPNLLSTARLRAREAGFSRDLYQELFKAGILNPKAP